MVNKLTLDPAYYASWSCFEVCAVLCDETLGKHLTKDECKTLIEANFTGEEFSLIIDSFKTTLIVLDNIDVFPDIGRNLLKLLADWALTHLAPKLYHKWDENRVNLFLNEEYQLKGITGEELKGWVPYALGDYPFIYHKGKRLDLTPKLRKKICETQIIVEPYCNFLDEYQCDQIEKQQKVDILKSLGLIVYERSTLCKIDEILSFLELFEKSVAAYVRRASISVSKYNGQLSNKKLDIIKNDSNIYMYPKELKHNELDEHPNSCPIACSFAPTFPINKYNERESYIQRNRVLTFVESPGTGKTHFGFHLTSVDRLVIPLGVDHLYTLHKTFDASENRMSMDSKVQQFVSFYHSMACLLFKFSERYLQDIKKTGRLPQYILRFLSNAGGEWIGERDFLSFNKIIPEFENNTSVFLLDEVHRIDEEMPIKVPNRNGGDETFLTLLMSWLRLKAGVIMTTTYFSSIEGKITSISSIDEGKEPLEKYSYDFPLLPVLKPNQVLQFLNYFINVPTNSSVWRHASFFLQGTIRTSEAFLQRLYFNSFNDNIEGDEIILKSLNGLTLGKQELKLVNKFDSSGDYQYMFYKLAITGEIKGVDINIKEEDKNITRFLMCNGVSFTYLHEFNTYKLSSCLERERMLNFVFKKFKNKWVDEMKPIIVTQEDSCEEDLSSLAELFVIDILLHHFDKLIAPLLTGSYMSSYIPTAKYYFEDSQISEQNKDDIQMSSLMIEFLASNYSNCNQPICNFLSRPNSFATIDILGILRKRRDSTINQHPNNIPLTVAITRSKSLEKQRKDFARTDLQNIYKEQCTIEENKIVNYEYAKIKGYLQQLNQRGTLRILFHPNYSFKKSLAERINDGMFDIESKRVNIKQSLSPFSVLTENNDCIVEIISGIEQKFPEWKEFMKRWKTLFKI